MVIIHIISRKTHVNRKISLKTCILNWIRIDSIKFNKGFGGAAERLNYIDSTYIHDGRMTHVVSTLNMLYTHYTIYTHVLATLHMTYNYTFYMLYMPYYAICLHTWYTTLIHINYPPTSPIRRTSSTNRRSPMHISDTGYSFLFSKGGPVWHQTLFSNW